MDSILEFFYSGLAGNLAVAGILIAAFWIAWVYRYNR